VQRADRVMTATRAMLEMLRGSVAVPESRAVVNPFGVPEGRFRPGSRSSGNRGTAADEETRFLYVSEYADYKNLATLLTAVRLLHKRGERRFRLATTVTPDQKFEKMDQSISREKDDRLLRDPDVAAHLDVLGPVAYERVPELYQRSDIFIFPSIAESFGHPLVEAMASGLPVIASDIPVHREICGDAALYFDPLCARALADCMARLRSDVSLRDQLVAHGVKRVPEHFAWDDHVARLHRILLNLTSQSLLGGYSHEGAK
jgi:glycosyltransferase involved in cell wall biosynthesis